MSSYLLKLLKIPFHWAFYLIIVCRKSSKSFETDRFGFFSFFNLKHFLFLCLVCLKRQVAICRTGSLRNSSESHFSRKTLHITSQHRQKKMEQKVFLSQKTSIIWNKINVLLLKLFPIEWVQNVMIQIINQCWYLGFKT